MSNEQVYEIELKPQPAPNREPAGMILRIAVVEGDIVSISGSSGGLDYEGSLTLRRKKVTDVSAPAHKDMATMTETNPGDEGGDECYRCIPGEGCRWYNPCPID